MAARRSRRKKRGWEEKAREALEREGNVPVEEAVKLMVLGLLDRQVNDPGSVDGIDVAHCLDSYANLLKATNKDEHLDALQEVMDFHEEPE